jgi:hypothetical protein
MKTVIADPETGQRHRTIPDLDATGELRIFPGAADVHVD